MVAPLSTITRAFLPPPPSRHNSAKRVIIPGLSEPLWIFFGIFSCVIVIVQLGRAGLTVVAYSQFLESIYENRLLFSKLLTITGCTRTNPDLLTEEELPEELTDGYIGETTVLT